jgi:deazaflavin-dependent oxidoreductase (nitroreductase family)
MTDMLEFNKQIIEEFRANAGKVKMFAGAPVVLLTTTGAKSGLPRVSPLVALIDGDTPVVFASKGGAPTDPDWYRNLVADPVVTVEYGTETFTATARIATGAERNALYERQVAVAPQFGEYAKATTREIPVVVLERN